MTVISTRTMNYLIKCVPKKVYLTLVRLSYKSSIAYLKFILNKCICLDSENDGEHDDTFAADKSTLNQQGMYTFHIVY